MTYSYIMNVIFTDSINYRLWKQADVSLNLCSSVVINACM